MNLADSKYSEFFLVKEMIETVELIKDFKPQFPDNLINDIKNAKGIFIAGEGSSRIFPAKNIIHQALRLNSPINIISEGAMQSKEYDLSNYIVFGVSNSGKTKEVVQLFNELISIKHSGLIGVACHENVPLAILPNNSFFLKCGEEKAVAATKSVIFQALFFQYLLNQILDLPELNVTELSAQIEQALTQQISDEIKTKVSSASTVYFSGRNDGVSEELALKTNEITRQQSAFLPGTYLLHGIEEVVNPNDTLVLINPFEDELQKIEQIYSKDIGANVVAISEHSTPFPTVNIPKTDAVNKGYLNLVAGWNLLVEVGIELGINLDKPNRARKIGNEFISSIV